MTPADRQTVIDALEGVIRVADRKTDEFDAARAALAIMREDAQREHLAWQLLARKRSPVDVADYGAPALREG